jgi:peptidoglycan/xylan/chitin deacetylase (PgdA/CDA1 family)
MSPASVAIGAGATGLAGIGGLIWACLSPKIGPWGRVYSRGLDGAAGYTLTFDDGPTRDSTAAILDILRDMNAPATFFVVGANARQCPDLLKRIHREGHIVANHSFHHAHLAMFRGRKYWDRELRETDAIIEKAIGLRSAMFRPPMGIKTWYVTGAAARQGHSVITWSRRGFDGVKTTPQRILNRLVPNTLAGDILVLHDGNEPNSKRDPTITVAALRPLILQLRDRGLEPMALDRLLRLEAYAPVSSEAARA